MHEVLVNRLGGLSLPRKSVVRLTDRPDMTLDVYRGRKLTMQQQQQIFPVISECRLKDVWLGRRDHDTEQTQARDFWLRGYKKKIPVVHVPCKQRENLFLTKLLLFRT